MKNTVAIRQSEQSDTSREKLYEELGLESLQLLRWYKKLSCFHKLFNSEHPSYITRNMYNIPFFKTKWNKLDHNKTLVASIFLRKESEIYQAIC